MTVELACSTHGDDGAPWLFLGSALGTTRDLWSAQLEALAANYRVVGFDIRGHGGSPAPPGPYAMADLAGDVLALADRLGAHRFAYAGVSIGGAIGLQLAVDAPERLTSLVACSTGAKLGEPATWTERAERVRREGTTWLIDVNRARWFTAAISGAAQRRAERLLAGIADADPEGYACCCEAIAGFDLRSRLGSIRVPTRVIAGTEDQATPAALTEQLNADIPAADLVRVPGASHLGVVERPEPFNDAILEHLTPRR